VDEQKRRDSIEGHRRERVDEGGTKSGLLRGQRSALACLRLAVAVSGDRPCPF
jgi:hypothetical protein